MWLEGRFVNALSCVAKARHIANVHNSAILLLFRAPTANSIGSRQGRQATITATHPLAVEDVEARADNQRQAIPDRRRRLLLEPQIAIEHGEHDGTVVVSWQ